MPPAPPLEYEKTVATIFTPQSTSITRTGSVPQRACSSTLYPLPVIAAGVTPGHDGDRERARHRAAHGGLQPHRKRAAPEPSAQREQAIGERHRCSGGCDTEAGVDQEGAWIAELVVLVHGQHRVLAQHAALDHGCDGRRDDDAGEDRLIQLTDQFLRW